MDMLEKIEILLSEKGINRAELSRGADIPYTTIDGMWKKGTDNIKRTTLVKLAKYFRCSIDYLADDEIELDGRSNCLHASENSSEAILQLISQSEFNHIKKFRALDERGKISVELMLNSQYDSLYPKAKTENEVS